MKDVMLDLETFGNSYNAVVVQIGICYFDRYTGDIGDKLLINIDADSSIKAGFCADASTIYWWLSQSKEAQDSICNVEKMQVSKAIYLVNEFLSKAKAIWSHATFDFVILMNHLNKLSLKPKFHYRAARDLRTLVDLTDIDYSTRERVGIHHNALDDCIFQVGYAVDCFNKLRKE
jgi:hypothetical protein